MTSASIGKRTSARALVALGAALLWGGCSAKAVDHGTQSKGVTATSALWFDDSCQGLPTDEVEALSFADGGGQADTISDVALVDRIDDWGLGDEVGTLRAGTAVTLR